MQVMQMFGLLTRTSAALAAVPPHTPRRASSSPTHILPAAGQDHSCAVRLDMKLVCWGQGGLGELGYGAEDMIGDDEVPFTAGPVPVGAGRSVTAVDVGTGHTCAILDTGELLCWGSGTGGKLGYGNTQSIGDDEPASAAGPVSLGTGRTAVAVSAGGHTCAILDNGDLLCWGMNTNGQLGYGNVATVGDNEVPSSVGAVQLGSGRSASAVSVGGIHTCVVLDTEAVLC